MTDERKKQVQQRIAKDVTPKVKTALDAADAALAELKGSIADVDDALKNTPDARIVEGVERDLAIDSRNGGKATSLFIEPLTALKQATADDDDFEADQDEIKDIKKRLALKLQALKDMLEEADKRKQAIEKWKVGSAKDEKAAAQTWIMIGDEIESDENDFKKAAKAVDAWVAEAEKAAKAKDAATLKKLQAKPPPLDVSDIKDGKYSGTYTTKYLKRYTVASFSKELQARIAKDAAAFKATDKRLQTIALQYVAAKAKVAKLK